VEVDVVATVDATANKSPHLLWVGCCNGRGMEMKMVAVAM
jgi:hypothetical protein